TTVTARWARGGAGVRVAWLTLEPFDDKPAAFWSDVLAALRAAGAVPPGHPLESLVVPPRLTPALLRRILGAIELLPEPVVLVLDDFHHAACAAVAETVDDLLRYPLPLHLVVLTRVDPLLRLQTLRARGEVAEVGAAALAFGAADVVALALASGRGLDPHGVDRVLDETGGWAVGVRLRAEADDAASRARADRSAAEFLLAVVLDRQEPATPRFLLRSRDTPAVCHHPPAVPASWRSSTARSPRRGASCCGRASRRRCAPPSRPTSPRGPRRDACCPVSRQQTGSSRPRARAAPGTGTTPSCARCS